MIFITRYTLQKFSHTASLVQIRILHGLTIVDRKLHFTQRVIGVTSIYSKFVKVRLALLLRVGVAPAPPSDVRPLDRWHIETLVNHPPFGGYVFFLDRLEGSRVLIPRIDALVLGDLVDLFVLVEFFDHGLMFVNAQLFSLRLLHAEVAIFLGTLPVVENHRARVRIFIHSFPPGDVLRHRFLADMNEILEEVMDYRTYC